MAGNLESLEALEQRDNMAKHAFEECNVSGVCRLICRREERLQVETPLEGCCENPGLRW